MSDVNRTGNANGDHGHDRGKHTSPAKDGAATQSQGQPSSSTTDSHNRQTLPLTEANLGLHNAAPCSEDKGARVTRLQEAAQQLGFELPEKSFEEEKWGRS